MRVYLDNCCYNRPFDDQDQLKVRLETEAKLRIQFLMRTGVLEYAWSDMLSLEVLDNPVPSHRDKILEWKDGASVNVTMSSQILAAAKRLTAIGVGNADALHVASARQAGCDWFFTTDIRLLKKVRTFDGMRLANPVEFLLEDEP